MPERKTLLQLRSLPGFDLVQLAQASGLSTATVYHALLRQPIGEDEAGQLLLGLHHVTGIVWTKETVDIVLLPSEEHPQQ